MDFITLDYASLKSRRSDLGLSLRHVTLLAADGETVRGYTVYAAATDYCLKADLDAGTADFTDFVSNLLYASTGVASDAGVLALVNKPRSIGDSGLSLVATANFPVAASNLTKSWQITVPANTTEITDICIWDSLVGPTGKCYLAGGLYKCRTSAVEGTALHFACVDRDDVTGLFHSQALVVTGLTGVAAQGLAVVGQTSGASGGIFKVENDGTIQVVFAPDVFTDGETLKIYAGAEEVGSATLVTAVVIYNLTRTSMTLSNVLETIEVGDVVTGDTSGQTARVLSIIDATHIEVSYANGPFTDGEDVSFTAGATATCDDWVEGDVVELMRSVRDEWLEGTEEGVFKPGDSKQLCAGLYFRVICYNADVNNALRLKITLEMATA